MKQPVTTTVTEEKKNHGLSRIRSLYSLIENNVTSTSTRTESENHKGKIRKAEQKKENPDHKFLKSNCPYKITPEEVSTHDPKTRQS